MSLTPAAMPAVGGEVLTVRGGGFDPVHGRYELVMRTPERTITVAAVPLSVQRMVALSPRWEGLPFPATVWLQRTDTGDGPVLRVTQTGQPQADALTLPVQGARHVGPQSQARCRGAERGAALRTGYCQDAPVSEALHGFVLRPGADCRTGPQADPRTNIRSRLRSRCQRRVADSQYLSRAGKLERDPACSCPRRSQRPTDSAAAAANRVHSACTARVPPTSACFADCQCRPAAACAGVRPRC